MKCNKLLGIIFFYFITHYLIVMKSNYEYYNYFLNMTYLWVLYSYISPKRKAGNCFGLATSSIFVDFNFTTRQFWGFPLYHPAFFGISSLLPGTIRNSHFTTGREDEAFQCFNHYLKLNFRCRRDNNYISRVPRKNYIFATFSIN